MEQLYKLKEVAQIADVGYRTLLDAQWKGLAICGIETPKFYKMGRSLVCATNDGDRFASALREFKRNHISLKCFADRMGLNHFTIRKAMKAGVLYGTKMPDSKLLNNERWFLCSEVDAFFKDTINHVLMR